MGYWDKKVQNQKLAVSHTEKMEKMYRNKIENCIAHTKVYDDTIVHPEATKELYSNVTVEATDSVSAIFNAQEFTGKIAVLNFASYKNPGGMFIEGSSAQEECLCHASFLYNVLREKLDYYKENAKVKNKALYTNKALYSPSVMFFDSNRNNIAYADVITCAAPNLTAAKEYCHVSNAENTVALTSRIKFVLAIAENEQAKNLILGAYGCGVFGQDPEEVAKIFKEELESGKYSFENVVFAIPGGINLEKFQAVFGQ